MAAVRTSRLEGSIAALLPLWAFALVSLGSRVRRCPDAKCAKFFLRTGKMVLLSSPSPVELERAFCNDSRGRIRWYTRRRKS